MSFIVANRAADFVLLAADTRSTWRPVAGGPAECFEDGGPKVIPWRNGWLASGPSQEWRNGISNGADPQLLIHEIDSELAAFVRQNQWSFATSPGRLDVFNWEGRPPMGTLLPVQAMYPRGADLPTMQQLVAGYTYATQGRAFASVLTATRQLYREVYSLTGPAGTMSAMMWAGNVWADGRRELLGPFSLNVEVTA